MSDRDYDRFEETYRSPREETMAELFAEATARLEAGEPLDEILAGAPAAHRSELRAMLAVSEMLLAGQQAPVPARSAQRRAEQRALFMAEAERARHEFVAAGAAKAPAQGAARPQPTVEETGLIGLLVLTWRTLQDAFTLRPYRLAPLMLTLLLSFGMALGITRAADAAVPGDPTYALKQWVNRMNLTLASPADAAQVQAQITAEFEQDLIAAAERTQNAPAQVDLNSLVVEERATLVFDGFMGNGVLKFGDVLVLPNFQPDANSSDVQPMTVSGDLVPGATVQVTMRILPGQPEYVQGVSAYVIAPPVDQAAEPPPVRGGEPVPPPPTPTATPCQPYSPAGWGVYTVQRGDTLSALAQRTGTPIYSIVGANCLNSDVIRTGQPLYLPSAPAPEPTPLPPPVEWPTPLPTVEPPTVEPLPTEFPTVEPPTVEPTFEPPTVEPLPTELPTVEPPTVEPPTVEPPTVEPLPTELPTVEPPTVEPPTATTEPPTVEPPTVEPLPTELPTIEPPTVEPPTATIEPPTVEPLPTDAVVSPGGADPTATTAPLEPAPAPPEPTPVPPEPTAVPPLEQPTAQPPAAEPPAAEPGSGGAGAAPTAAPPPAEPTAAPLEPPAAQPDGNAPGEPPAAPATAPPLAVASTIAPAAAPAATAAQAAEATAADPTATPQAARVAQPARRRGSARLTVTPTATPTATLQSAAPAAAGQETAPEPPAAQPTRRAPTPRPTPPPTPTTAPPAPAPADPDPADAAPADAAPPEPSPTPAA